MPELIELGLFEGSDHSVWMSDQVDVDRILKVLFGAPERFGVRGVEGGLFDQDPLSQPVLQHSIVRLGRQLLVFELAHQALDLFETLMCELHQAAQVAFAQKVLGPRKPDPSVGQVVERQQEQLGRCKQSRASSKHHP